MRYPKHLILDVSTPQAFEQPNWQRATIRTSFPKFKNRLNSTLPNTLSLSEPYLKLPKEQVTSRLYFSPTNTFDINFIRKEKLYTKLKYSRCPQYDIVSGGFAAILAGFIGFLISEKFGIELVDSGDFYIAFMYGVIGVFSMRPLVRIYSKDSALYTPVSLNFLLTFIHDITLLLLQEIKFLLGKVVKKS